MGTWLNVWIPMQEPMGPRLRAPWLLRSTFVLAALDVNANLVIGCAPTVSRRDRDSWGEDGAVCVPSAAAAPHADR